MTSLVWPIMRGGIVIVIALLGVFAVWRIVKERRSGFPSQDERTRRITGKASTYALVIGQYFIIALLAVNLINEVFYDSPAFEAGYALIASLLVSSLSFLGLRLYFGRKGDS